MTERDPQNRAISDAMVDSFFDRELTEGAADEFFVRLRSNLPRCAEVARMQRAISMLREPVEAPDVSDRVMATLSRRRRFLPERLRAMVTAGRLAAAGVALAAVLGLAVADRVAPGFLKISEPARPLSDVVSSTTQDAQQGMAHLAAAVNVRVTTDPGSGGRAFLVGTLEPGVTSAKLLPKGSGDSEALVVYRGAGPDTRFVLPEAVYIDRNAAILVPLGHMSSTRIGAMDWAGISRENLFLLPAVEPGVASGVAPVGGRRDKDGGDRK